MGRPEDEPPSYQEAINTPGVPSSSSSSSHTRPQQPRPPPAMPPRTQSLPYSHTSQFPPASSSSPPSSFQHSSAPPLPPQDQPQLPFTYPRNYRCKKCNNTGYKLKNGRTCKDCWDSLAPRNTYNHVSTNYAPNYFGCTTYVPYQGYGPPPGPSAAPLRVSPGDPRLGGVLCGRCRGSGMVRFLLDMELCPVCSGLGRVVNLPRPVPQQGSPTYMSRVSSRPFKN